MQLSARQRGVSLVELLLAMAISLILLAGILTVSLRISTAGGEAAQAARLNQQLRAAMAFLSRDLERAGAFAWFPLWDDDDGDGDPADGLTDPAVDGDLADLNGDGGVGVLDYFQAVKTAWKRFGPVRLQRFPTPGDPTSGTPADCTVDCDCVLYSYDLDRDGLQGVGGASGAGSGQDADNFELFGFRWNGQALEQRVAVASAADAASCDAGTWVDVTDDTLTVTGFAVSLNLGEDETGDSALYEVEVGGATKDADPKTSCTPSMAGEVPAAGDILCLHRRSLELTLAGALAQNPEVHLTLTSKAKIRNDYLETP
ncbi:MAG: hypothetical protein KatS3mg124_1606 [Porticoccaceae bacterium]|nr:MAG: hypothetical protein KatS3mg124_1606 [Porticoccaceae bacterium]